LRPPLMMARYVRARTLRISTADSGQVFIWKVPENFTLHTDADEPADVAPQAKLSGHMRCALPPLTDDKLLLMAL
jgi:hypothetical protein